MKNRLLFAFFCLSLSCNKIGSDIPIPDLTVRNARSNSVFNTRSILPGSPFVVILFQTDCRLCQKEMSEITSNIRRFGTTRFYLISNDTQDRLDVFRSYYGLDSISNILLLRDDQRVFSKYYKPGMVPYIMIFDSDKVLRVVYAGGVSVGEIYNKIIENKIKRV